jgi:hypothetical protein
MVVLKSKPAEEAQRLMKMFRQKSVIWAMDAGLIIILHPKYKPDNTDLQR